MPARNRHGNQRPPDRPRDPPSPPNGAAASARALQADKKVAWRRPPSGAWSSWVERWKPKMTWSSSEMHEMLRNLGTAYVGR